MSYSVFARYYDDLTRNVDYRKRADYLCALLRRLGHSFGLTLDLACGTGSLTLELAGRGVDVYGIDASPDMLSAAQRKAAASGKNILFLRQRMQAIDLYGTVDTVVCALDSINHLTEEDDVRKTFERVSLFLNPGGYFLFDINTEYKHRTVLGNHVFVYDTDSVYCIWQNRQEENGRVAITLDFFGREGNVYRRDTEHFSERAYSAARIESLLSRAGLEMAGLFSDLTFCPPDETTERIVVAARKK